MMEYLKEMAGGEIGNFEVSLGMIKCLKESVMDARLPN